MNDHDTENVSHAFYPAFVDQDDDRPEAGYGLIIPDLPGCHSAGDTYAELFSMGREAVELHMQSYFDEDEPIPPPTTVERWKKNNPDYTNGTWILIYAELPTEKGKWLVTEEQRRAHEADVWGEPEASAAA